MSIFGPLIPHWYWYHTVQTSYTSAFDIFRTLSLASFIIELVVCWQGLDLHTSNRNYTTKLVFHSSVNKDHITRLTYHFTSSRKAASNSGFSQVRWNYQYWHQRPMLTPVSIELEISAILVWCCAFWAYL